jgi:hypothetical protein
MAFTVAPINALATSEETTSQFLVRRERELLAQASALRGMLGPLEEELADIQKAKNALAGKFEIPADAAQDLGDALAKLGSIATKTERFDLAAEVNSLAELFSPSNALRNLRGNMTIKQMVVQALIDHFPKGGSSAQIRDYIRNAYGRAIDPGSLRPQMHRLKADSILFHEPTSDTWNLTDHARGSFLFSIPPTSRRTMKELQDGPDDEQLLRWAEQNAWREPGDKS